MYVYETTNLINGKKYIGVSITKNKTKSEKYLGSGVLLKRAIKKYGVENFCKVILKEFENEDEARDYERYLIDFIGAIDDKNYYNLVAGGYGGGIKNHSVSEETKKKISDAQKGKKLPENQIENMSKKVLKYSKDGDYICEYKSRVNAEKESKIFLTKLNGNKTIYAGGFMWRYKDDSNVEYKILAYSEIEKLYNIEVSKQVGKLSKEKVIQLVKDKEKGATYKELSEKYNISQSCAYEIVIGKTYTWVWEN